MTAVLTALRAAEAKTAQETLSQRVNRLQAEAKLRLVRTRASITRNV